MSSAILFARNLTIGYAHGKNSKIVHSDLTLNLRPGCLTCLLGPNGAGKSTLLRTLGGTQAPLGGTIELAGRPLASYSRRELSKQIGLVLTERAATDGLTVSELVALGRHPHTGFFGRLDATDHAAVDEAMRLTGIYDKRQSFIGELSDGERQKAMIAKALAQAAPVIILDEPTSFLDVTSRIEVMHLLRRVAIEQQKAILLSTHDLEQALLLSDRLWLLGKQSGLQEGNPVDLIASGAIDAMFGRENIYLDKRSGSFRLRPKSQRLAIVSAANDTLRFLTEDLLSRYGISVTDAESSNTSFNPAASGEVSTRPLRIEVRSTTDILVVDTIRLTSFEALAEHCR